MKINEIFNSLSGEVDGHGGQGKPATFVRLQGCNLKNGCSYCDSPRARHAAKNGTEMTVDEVITKISMPKVIITGGEPLMQYSKVSELVRRLLDQNIPTTIETNGSIVVPKLFPRHSHNGRKEWLRIVMDYKLPSSGMEQYMDGAAFGLLRSWDVIKFVIGGDTDYTRMKALLDLRQWEAQIAISPVLDISGLDSAQGYESARTLARIMIADPDLKHACFSLQIHKLLGIR